MSTPRPVRIPRSSPTRTGVTTRAGAAERRVNRAGSQRAVRFALLYVVALLVLDAVLVSLDLSSAEAGRPAVVAGLQLFLAVAAALAVGSVLFALSPAPRVVEVGAERTVVVGRWGSRRTFPPLAELEPKVVRRYPGGLLSHRAVEIVRVVDRRGRRATYQIEAGLLDPIYDPTGFA